MTTNAEDRLLGLAVAALLTAIGGELAGVAALAALGVTTFALALATLFDDVRACADDTVSCDDVLAARRPPSNLGAGYAPGGDD